ncbi:MAG: FAD-binding oxidoreductase [Gammaproteobacteria bacterium]|nr:FAD-binding oxidoreductase [Gammaproteobacteria bacterium]
MNDFDTIVIGGGLIGASVAYGLSRSGQRVAMFDEGDNAIRAARGNFGLIWVQGKGANNLSYANWTRQSARQWPDFNKELTELTGIDLAFEQNGGFDFCLNEIELSERHILMEQMAADSAGEFSYQMFNNSELKQILPNIGPTVTGASFSKLDGHVNPLYLLKALHKAFKQLCGRLITKPVIDINYKNKTFKVSTVAHEFTSEKVILAAGFSNKTLAPKVGLNVPVYPQRGEILVTEKVKPFLRYPTGLVRQTHEGGLMLGDSHEDVGFDEDTNMNEIQQIAKRAIAIFPCLESVKVIRAWGSLRILTKDGLPIYDHSDSCPGAYAFSSHSGVTLSAVHALDIASCIAKDGLLPSSLACFSARRFDV